MRKSYSRDRIANALAWSGFLIGLAGVAPLIFQTNVTPFFWLFLVPGLAVLLLSLAVGLSQTFYTWVTLLFLGRGSLAISAGADCHVEGVQKIAKQYFGETTTNQEKTKEIISKYKDGLRVACAKNREGEIEVVGYYFLFPINKRCVDRIYAFDFDIGSISSDDIATKPRFGYAMYVGAIAAKGWLARAELLGALKATEDQVALTKTKTAYARAATKRGREVLLQHGFKPVHSKADDVECFYRKTF